MSTQATGWSQVKLQNDRLAANSRRRRWSVPGLLRDRAVVVSLAVLLVLYIIAIIAPWLAPHEPNHQELMARLQGPSRAHLFGTDGLGRDVFSRALYAARISLTVSIIAMAITIVVGTVIGLVSGFAGGALDNLMMRLTDIFLAFPVFLLLITVISIYGSSLTLLIVFLGLSAWPQTARTVRAEVLSLRRRDYIDAARVCGAPTYRILFRELLPNVVPVLVVAATLRVASVILIEAGLSYFGLGVTPPTPTWGNMVTDGRLYLDTAWWITAFPGIFIVITVLAYNALGDGLRTAFDPRFRKR